MNLFEYIASQCDALISVDEYGNCYIRNFDRCLVYDFPDRDCLVSLGGDDYMVVKEDYEKLSAIDIIIRDKEITDTEVRRPYFRMRGYPISREQAFDIISRCDRYLGFDEDIYRHELYLGSGDFSVNTMWTSIYPRSISWVAPDGRVGINDITSKYPEIEELLLELFKYLYNFPYLNFVVAMTFEDDLWWNDGILDSGEEGAKPDDRDFYGIIAYGFHVHDGKIELVGKSEAVRLYREYEKPCGFPSENFTTDYYEDLGTYASDTDFIRKCAERYDIDVDAFMTKYIEEKNRG